MTKIKCVNIFKIGKKAGRKCTRDAVIANYTQCIAESGIINNYCRICARNKNYAAEKPKKKSTRDCTRARRSSRINKKSNVVYKINTNKKITEKKNKKQKILKKTLTNKNVDEVEDIDNEGTDAGLSIEERSEDYVASSEESFRYFPAHVYANLIVSQNATEKILQVMKNEKMIEKAVSRTTISRTVVEAANICNHLIAEVLPFLTELVVSIDESPKHNGRSFVVLLLNGTMLKDNCHWYCNKAGLYSFNVGFVECYSKTSNQLCELIENVLEKFKNIQKELPKKTKEVSFLDIFSISADWTSSNSGQHAGLVKLVDQKKKLLDINASKTNFNGCNDHLVSLVSKNYVSNTLPAILEHFKVKSPISALSSLLNHTGGINRTKFNGFTTENFSKTISVKKFNETRYCSVPLAAKCFSNNIEIFKKYIEEHVVEGCKYEEIFNEYSIEIIYMLSNTADSFFLPFMKKVSENVLVKDYVELIEYYISEITSTFISVEKFEDFWCVEITEKEKEELENLQISIFINVEKALNKIEKLKDNFSTRSTIFVEEDYIYNKISPSSPIIFFYILCFEWSLDTIFTLSQKSKLILANNYNENSYIKTTNRDGEGSFSIFNRFFEKNANINSLIAESIFVIRSVTNKNFDNLKKIINHYSREEFQCSKHWMTKVISVANDQLSCFGNKQLAANSYLNSVDKSATSKKEETLRNWCKLFVERNSCVTEIQDDQNTDCIIDTQISQHFNTQESQNSCFNNSSNNSQNQYEEEDNLSQNDSSKRFSSFSQTTLDSFLVSNSFPNITDKLITQTAVSHMEIFKTLSEDRKKNKSKGKKEKKKKSNFKVNIYKAYKWIFSELKNKKKKIRGTLPKCPNSINEAVKLFLGIAKIYHEEYFPNVIFSFGK